VFKMVAKAASFREPLKRRRCIVPALGWYEWQALPAGKLPWYLHGADGELLAFAGLWDRWEGASDAIESCSIIVGPANAAFGKIHDRMPFVLSRERAERWLDRKRHRRDRRAGAAAAEPRRRDCVSPGKRAREQRAKPGSGFDRDGLGWSRQRQNANAQTDKPDFSGYRSPVAAPA
jgi:putative SOS response-associated peptidase YedK